jgi:hypothetical protein
MSLHVTQLGVDLVKRRLDSRHLRQESLSFILSLLRLFRCDLSLGSLAGPYEPRRDCRRQSTNECDPGKHEDHRYDTATFGRGVNVSVADRGNRADGPPEGVRERLYIRLRRGALKVVDDHSANRHEYCCDGKDQRHGATGEAALRALGELTQDAEQTK